MILVQKFGGTSVGSIERIENAANKVINAIKRGYKPVVVSSAMSGETERLIKLAKSIEEHPNYRELDQLISTGEQQAIALFALMLIKKGYDAVSLCGWQIPIETDDIHFKANIKNINTKKIFELLEKNIIPVVAGFQGIDEHGDITTLGRGGSDTTAVALAGYLKADCEIYTDVNGVYTTDPRIVKHAKKIDYISYEEMLEMASLGAKVMQIKSVEFAAKFGSRIHVRSSFEDTEGTWIVPEEEIMEKKAVRAITADVNESRITITHIPDKPGIAAEIFKSLGESHIVVDMIVQNVSVDGYTDMSFTVNKNDAHKAEEITKKVAKQLNARDVLRDDDVAKISVVGIGMKSAYGIAGRMFEVLAANNINIKAISTSEIKISCLIDEKYTELAVRALHEEFIEKDES
ncbi:MAG: aspartate kinase [Hydrogenobaculum sp.]